MENETLKQIDELLTELSASRESYESWKAQQPNSHLMEQERSAWLSIKDRTHLIDAEALNAWKAREPGLSTNPDVIAAKRRITELQAELITEQKQVEGIGRGRHAVRAVSERSSERRGFHSWIHSSATQATRGKGAARYL
jgi:hypothetical protein